MLKQLTLVPLYRTALLTPRNGVQQPWPQRNPAQSRWAVICQLVGLLCLFYSFCAPTVQARSMTTAPTVVDQTQNIKAMGYTDSRKVVRDSQGNLYVAYRKKYKLLYETAYHIFVAKSTDNGITWTVLNHDQPIETVGDFNQRVPAIAIDRWDILHVVWYGPDATTANDDENQIKYVRSTDAGVTWSPWRNLTFVAGYRGQALWQEHPTIFVGNDHVLYVVWEGRDDWYTKSGQIKLTKSSDDGLSWSPWINIAPSTQSRSRPSLVSTGAQLYAFAYGSSGGIQQILYATSTDGGSRWSRWRQVVATSQDQRHVSAAVDSAGMIHIVWRQPPFTALNQQGDPTQIYYASFDGATWSPPVRVGTHPGIAQTYPSITVDAAQRVWITWLETTDPYDFPNDAPTTGSVYYVAKTAHGWSNPILYGAGANDLYPSLRRNLTAGEQQMDAVWLEALPTGYAIRFAQLALPTTFIPTAKVAEPIQSSFWSPFTRIAWALEFDSAQLRSLPTKAMQQSEQVWRDMLTILMIIAVVSVYVTTKFLLSRWLNMVLR